MNDQEKKERIREEIATDILGYHLGTPIDSYGTPRVPQPVWCNDKRCKKYKENCEYCITDKILAIEGLVIESDNQELPGFKRGSVCSFNTVLDDWGANGFAKCKQEMSDFKRVI